MGLKHQRRTSDSALFLLSLNASFSIKISGICDQVIDKFDFNFGAKFMVKTFITSWLVSPLFNFNLFDGQGHGLDLGVHSRGQNKCVRP